MTLTAVATSAPSTPGDRDLGRRAHRAHRLSAARPTLRSRAHVHEAVFDERPSGHRAQCPRRGRRRRGGGGASNIRHRFSRVKVGAARRRPGLVYVRPEEPWSAGSCSSCRSSEGGGGKRPPRFGATPLFRVPGSQQGQASSGGGGAFPRADRCPPSARASAGGSGSPRAQRRGAAAVPPPVPA